MLHYLTNPEYFDKPVLLANDAIPTEVIASVFADYSLLDQRTMIWNLIHAVLISENEEFSEPYARGKHSVCYIFSMMLNPHRFAA